MAQFTWRDVAAPDFSGAARGFSDAGRLLQDTVGKAVDGISSFDKSQSDLAAQQLALYVAQNQDPAALQAGFNSGNLGGMDLTGRRMQAAALDQLNPNKINAMIAGQRTQENATLSYNHAKAKEAATPQLVAILQAHLANKPEEAARLAAGVDFASIGYANAEQFLKEGPGLDRTAFADDNARDAYNDDTASTAAFQAIRAASLNGDDARMQLYDPEGMAKGLSTRARASLEAKLSGQYPDVFGSAGGTGAGAAIAGAVGPGNGGGPVSNGGYDRIVGDVVQPPKPPSTMTIAELEDYGNKVVIPATRAMSPAKRAQLGLTGQLGSSAMGKYQIIGDTALTHAKKLGWDPNTTVFDAAHQEALAESIFNDGKKGDLTKVFASLPQRPVGYYANRTWAEMRNEIAQGESGPSTAELAATSRDAQYQVASRSMQDSAHGLDIDFGTTLVDTRAPAEVADQLIGVDGPFKGTNRGFVVNQLNKIMREGKVNAATAGAVLTRNMEGKDNPLMNTRDFWRRMVTNGTPNLGGSVRLNDKGVATDIAILSKLDQGALLSQISARGVRSDLTGQIQTATAALAAAQNAYTQAQSRAITQPQLKASLPRYAADLAARKQALMMLQAQTQVASNRPQ